MDYDYAHRGSTDVHGHTAIASGYLFKVAHPLSRWHRRYYVLYSDGLLHSFKNDRARAANRVIPVGRLCLRMKFGEDTSYMDCSSWPKNTPKRLRFSIINSDRAYHFVCESDRDMEIWKRNLLGTLNKLASLNRSWVSEGISEEQAPVRPSAEETEGEETALPPHKAPGEELSVDPASPASQAALVNESDTGSLGPPLSERGSLGPPSEEGSVGPPLSERGSLGPPVSEGGLQEMVAVELENELMEEQSQDGGVETETQEYLEETNEDENVMVVSGWAETLVKDMIETVFNEMTQPPMAKSETTAPPVAKREMPAPVEPPMAKSEATAPVEPPMAKSETTAPVEPPVAERVTPEKPPVIESKTTADIGNREDKSHVRSMPEPNEAVDTTQQLVDKRKTTPVGGDKPTTHQPSVPKLESSAMSVRDRIKMFSRPSQEATTRNYGKHQPKH